MKHYNGIEVKKGFKIGHKNTQAEAIVNNNVPLVVLQSLRLLFYREGGLL